MRKGIMTDEMVKELNFGGGSFEGLTEADMEKKKKTREERFEEIMTKSKAFKMHAQEVKQATLEETRKLDDEWGEVAGLLNFNKRSKKEKVSGYKEDKFDNILTQLKTEGAQLAQPAKAVLTEKEKAKAKRERLEKLAKKQKGEEDDDHENEEFTKKREAKLQSKRDQALQAAMAQQEKLQKKADKANENLESIQKTIDTKKQNLAPDLHEFTVGSIFTVGDSGVFMTFYEPFRLSTNRGCRSQWVPAAHGVLMFPEYLRNHP